MKQGVDYIQDQTLLQMKSPTIVLQIKEECGLQRSFGDLMIKSTLWGIPGTHMAAQNCLQLPSPGIWILLTFERTRHASGIDIHCVGQTFTHIK